MLQTEVFPLPKTFSFFLLLIASLSFPIPPIFLFFPILTFVSIFHATITSLFLMPTTSPFLFSPFTVLLLADPIPLSPISPQSFIVSNISTHSLSLECPFQKSNYSFLLLTPTQSSSYCFFLLSVRI